MKEPHIIIDPSYGRLAIPKSGPPAGTPFDEWLLKFAKVVEQNGDSKRYLQMNQSPNFILTNEVT